MRGRADQLDPTSMGLMVRLGTLEARQERVVNINDLAEQAI